MVKKIRSETFSFGKPWNGQVYINQDEKPVPPVNSKNFRETSLKVVAFLTKKISSIHCYILFQKQWFSLCTNNVVVEFFKNGGIRASVQNVFPTFGFGGHFSGKLFCFLPTPKFFTGVVVFYLGGLLVPSTVLRIASKQVLKF